MAGGARWKPPPLPTNSKERKSIGRDLVILAILGLVVRLIALLAG
jgi:hypothetical protein